MPSCTRVCAEDDTAHTLPTDSANRTDYALNSDVHGSPAERTVVETCKEKISAMLEPIEIKVEGAFDDPNGSHISIYCVSEAFEGKRSMQRQQLVFKAIWDEMQGPIPPVHAVDSMVLKTPSEETSSVQPAGSQAAAPRRATPRHASRHATPRHATPRHATPRHATPRHATPRHATPRHATPRTDPDGPGRTRRVPAGTGGTWRDLAACPRTSSIYLLVDLLIASFGCIHPAATNA
eukprot:CAMPEP_0119344172 /NCGR_PEP_ID=MMETSP1333-20130426/106833_1 /TAXON_ID=418940 /ORGANISM="Scyphosphaera apsteinii, Strain RCC1455" /LENGTH=235 /DNA_ID=CAMNT_0007356599 /DNA_START=61 /DNA_END=770 /DNA_ORIENTATION=-